MKGSPFKLRSPLKQDITMDSTIGDVGRKIKNTSIRDAGEGLLNAATGGAYGNVKAIYNKMKQRDGGHDDMMKTPKKDLNKKAVMEGAAEASSERISSKRKEKPQSAVTITKKSGKLKKKKTEIIQPASKIKPSGIVKNPKI
jgi:hypothetical protein